ncbi:MAG: 23S rRNA (guanosine(2251)-2'-O)-methyltransferase RlmB [Xanthomonadales bacterium]|nr:23S rRNA (guanosine(2251)-2'-O)-methyltransferase RlmB [Xanthomonadales bacterium]
MSSEIWLVGPHAVELALQRHAERALELRVVRGEPERRLGGLIEQARRLGVAVQRSDADALARTSGEQRHQGIGLRFRALPQRGENDLEDLLNAATPPLLLVLDQVQDPHNLGACLRVAAAAGCNAVIVPKDRAAGLTPAVHRAAVGTSLIVPLLQVTNLARCLDQLKQAGVWLAGTAGEASDSVYTQDYRGAFGFVLGAEGEGMRKLTRERCDYLVRIPMAPDVESLNVSVAAGICLFEAVRQRAAS